MSNLKTPVSASDHTRGAVNNAQLEIVEYGDFQCPHCGHAEPIVQKIINEFGSVVSVTFRNFPLTEIHPMAYPAAEAVEASGKQNKYWAMHDFIFRNQLTLSNEKLIKAAESLELNKEQFLSDANSETVKQKIDEDFESGAMSGVNGTPSFFINGKKFDGGAEDLYNLIVESIV